MTAVSGVDEVAGRYRTIRVGAHPCGLAASPGGRFLYVANYLPRGHDLLDLDTEALLARYADGLRRANPAWERSWVRRAWRFAEPAAQPIVTVGYRQRIPALETGVPGLLLANTTQIYPEDRGTNYAVRLGGDAARALLAPRSSG